MSVMTPDELAFRHAVCERPEDDLPRLIYADWLRDQDEWEHAEFIEVQCRIEQMKREFDPQSPLPKQHPAHEEWKQLRRREQELYLKGNWFDIIDDDWIRIYDGCSTQHGHDGFRVLWRRGFAHQVYATAAQWLTHGPAILAVEPVQLVTLTDPRTVLHIFKQGKWWLRISRVQDSIVTGDEKGFDTREELVAGMPETLRGWGVDGIRRYTDGYGPRLTHLHHLHGSPPTEPRWTASRHR